MGELTIRGFSDDIVEIDGDIKQEFGHYDDENACYIAVSDGTVLRMQYMDNGFWRIQPLYIGSASFDKHEGTNADDDYSDVVTLDGQFEWVVCGDAVALAPRQTKDHS